MADNDFSSEFSGLFEALADEKIEAEFQAIDAKVQAASAAKTAPLPDGVWYVEDGVDGNAHTISWYRLVLGGKTVLWASVDNDRPLPGTLPNLPEGTTAHGIWVWNADRTKSEGTKGLAARYEHPDGTGIHVDGTTIRSFLAQRAGKYLGTFYGV